MLKMFHLMSESLSLCSLCVNSGHDASHLIKFGLPTPFVGTGPGPLALTTPAPLDSLQRVLHLDGTVGLRRFRGKLTRFSTICTKLGSYQDFHQVLYLNEISRPSVLASCFHPTHFGSRWFADGCRIVH